MHRIRQFSADKEAPAIIQAANMPYVTSAERFGIEKGRQEGRLEGRL
jgi:hypothetical protein